MTTLDRGPEIFSVLTKALKFENGALLLIGAMVSDPYTKVLKLLTHGIEPKDYVLPIVVASVSIFLYLVVSFFDFFYGLRASRHEAEDKKTYIKSEKLWSSMYKITAVLLVIFIVSIFSLLCAFIELSLLQKFFMYATGAFSFMAILYDLHSIGENYQRRFEKRLKIFDFIDNVAKAFNDRIIQKIKNL